MFFKSKLLLSVSLLVLLLKMFYSYLLLLSGKLSVNSEESEIRGGKIRVEFIKGYKDNPKINAMFVMKGKLEDVPKLPPLPFEPENIEEVKEEPEFVPKNRRPSGPKQPDPYSMDESSAMLPVFIAIGAFIPVLFCLCKL